MDGIYLDYAATSALRPETVIEAVERYLREVGATPGRSGHHLAIDAGRVALRCRRALARLFGATGDPGRIAFFPNATYALNAALHGILRPGDAVVRTVFDHNAVRRPVALLARRGVEERVLSGSLEHDLDLAELDYLLSLGGRPARLVVVPHATNVLGTALDLASIGEWAHAHGALLLVDAAQSAGHLPIDVEAMRIDLLAFTGHKGLLGPQGTGGLYVRPGVEIDPVWAGGTGGDSMPLEMPEAMPDRLEAGTLNGPGIAGLLAGVEWLAERGVEAVHAHETALKLRLRERLAAIDGVRVVSPAAPEGVGIVTIAADAISAAELAARLDREHGVMTRAGLHCAPEQHQLCGTAEAGAVRFSVGWATTEAEVDAAAEAVSSILEDTRRNFHGGARVVISRPMDEST
ncbi:MAG TPA: aminotransferase class V-fold PLP-dependent enzyme [Longimicrobiaceae bacterium]|nr:aminotransferase class V-fold PLP-dependent enzyme [Longimicrobiaceae bacterium]